MTIPQRYMKTCLKKTFIGNNIFARNVKIKHNVYFKNPKFAKEVTHSKSIIGKQETRVKLEVFFLISGKISSAGLNTY